MEHMEHQAKKNHQANKTSALVEEQPKEHFLQNFIIKNVFVIYGGKYKKIESSILHKL